MVFFETFLKAHPEVKPYIDGVQGTIGSGWSITIGKVGYGLTFRGIQLALTLMKVDTVACLKIEELQSFVNKTPIGSSRSCVIEPAVLKDEYDSWGGIHAITIYLDRNLGEDHLFILDCDASCFTSDYETIKKRYFPDRSLKMIQATNKRQNSRDYCCHVFSVHDCKQLAVRADLCTKLFDKSVFKGHCAKMVLPEEMALGEVERFEKKKELFKMVILSCLNK